ncbi:hypothetical protein ACFOG5_02395 [Pedobacter fastidiosus]|uniref:Uncharacterized protein n=1 Tax=Pedobacter fastidiosus TaxID=2765361 RepID=A0ABR7KXP0_9SPHI|nr:hypothetical protein [Pedobacter fastidiosus]
MQKENLNAKMQLLIPWLLLVTPFQRSNPSVNIAVIETDQCGENDQPLPAGDYSADENNQ